MSEVLTPIERRIYNYLVDYLKRETFQPSIREIGAKFGIRSTKTVTEHLQSLQRKGYLDRAPSRSRALKILGLNLSPQTYTIPLYRNGFSDSGDDEVEARFDLDRSLACSAHCFFVKAHGDGLGEQGVLDGDLILVDPCQEVAESETLVYDRAGNTELRVAERGSPVLNGDGVPGNGGSGPRYLGVARAVLRSLSPR
ncbi:MAG: hypothetical protein JSU87_10120 [Gemmatimonadota bacterium]|nr:MAG: hypothetical protein JSU87_10120 [Gemmatimonadota bacterium]